MALASIGAPAPTPCADEPASIQLHTLYHSNLARMAAHGNGIALIFARTETKAFQEHCWRSADAMLFMAGRIKFRLPGGGVSGPAGAPSVLIAYGQPNAQALRSSGIAGYVVDLANRRSEAANNQLSLLA